MRLHPTDKRFDLRLISAAILLGLLANSHTYAFILGMTIATVLLLDKAIVESDQRFLTGTYQRVVVAIATIIVVLILLEITNVAPLSRLLILWGISFVSTLIFSKNREERVRVLLFICIALFVSSPQIIKMFGAVVAHDAFLTSRQQVSDSLTVPITTLLIHHSPLLLLIFIASIISHRMQKFAQIRILVILTCVWIFLSFNQTWGLSQEPYRFAIDAQVPLSIFAMALILQGWRFGLNTFPLRVLGLVFSLYVFVPSVIEFQNFWSYRSALGVIQLDSAQYREMARASSEAPEGLILPDPCIEPSILKVVSRKKLAVYSKGLAWPENVDLFEQLVDDRVKNVLNLNAVRKLKIRSLLIDKSCPTQWVDIYKSELTPVTSEPLGRYQIYEFRTK